jgi:type IV secretory pathway VirB2 component (pilin)
VLPALRFATRFAALGIVLMTVVMGFGRAGWRSTGCTIAGR